MGEFSLLGQQLVGVSTATSLRHCSHGASGSLVYQGSEYEYLQSLRQRPCQRRAAITQRHRSFLFQEDSHKLCHVDRVQNTACVRAEARTCVNAQSVRWAAALRPPSVAHAQRGGYSRCSPVIAVSSLGRGLSRQCRLSSVAPVHNMTPNPSIERTCNGGQRLRLRPPPAAPLHAAHVER